MNITLEQIDLVRARTQAGYKEAKEALEQVNGDVLEAIILLEQEGAKTTAKFSPKIESVGSELLESLKELIRKGNVTRFYLEKDGRTILDIPVLAGAVGALLFTGASAVAIIAALASGCELKIVKQDGEIIDLRNVTDQTFQKVKAKVDELKNSGVKEESPLEETDEEVKVAAEEETEVIVEE